MHGLRAAPLAPLVPWPPRHVARALSAILLIRLVVLVAGSALDRVGGAAESAWWAWAVRAL